MIFNKYVKKNVECLINIWKLISLQTFFSKLPIVYYNMTVILFLMALFKNNRFKIYI